MSVYIDRRREEEGHYPHADRGAKLPKVPPGRFKGWCAMRPFNSGLLLRVGTVAPQVQRVMRQLLPFWLCKKYIV